MENINIRLFLQIGLTLILLISSFFILPIIHSLIAKYGRKQEIVEKRIAYIKKFFSFAVYLAVLLSFSLIWGIDFRGALIFASSFFAVVGVAFFASWSILSNITAGIILFFSFPYQLGDKIKLLDGDNTVSGMLVDITMFNLQIEDGSGNIATIPNNLVVQKTMIKYSDEQLLSVEK